VTYWIIAACSSVRIVCESLLVDAPLLLLLCGWVRREIVASERDSYGRVWEEMALGSVLAGNGSEVIVKT
jgi:hypothetical protein